MEENNKKGKGLVVVVVVLSILLVVAIGYICYDMFFGDVEKEEIVDNGGTVEKEYPTLDDAAIKELHSSLVTAENWKNTWGFYYDTKLTIESIPSDLLVKYAAMNYIDENNIQIDTNLFVCKDKSKGFYCDDVEGTNVVNNDTTKNMIIPKEKIDQYIREKFNTDREISFNDGTTIVLGYRFGYFLEYNQEDDSYYLYALHRGGAFYDVINEFVKSEQNEDEIYIYDKAFIFVGDEGGRACVKSFNLNLKDSDIFSIGNLNKLYDANGKEIADSEKYFTDTGYNYDAIFQDFDADIYNYKHTFKLAEDGKYYWVSSEIVE